jgi:citrate synthase
VTVLQSRTRTTTLLSHPAPGGAGIRAQLAPDTQRWSRASLCRMARNKCRIGGNKCRIVRNNPRMAEVHEGLEGVVAFATEIAEPDRAGSALRYRGVDIEDLVGRVPFEKVWGLLVDGTYEPGLPPAEPFPIPVHSGDIRVDVQSAIAMIAPAWGMRQLYDIDDVQARADLARTAVMVLSYVAQAARGLGLPMVPERDVDRATTITERFMTRWRGEPDPAHVKAVDAYWTSAAEHGMNASTFTARVVASTGADVAASLSAAVGAMSGPLHGGAPSRVLGMIEAVERRGDAARYVKDVLDSGERLMGFGHRVYRAEDPRARVLRRTAQQLAAPRYEVAIALEKAALEELRSRRPDRVLETNVEFWAAIVLDFAEIPAHMFTSMFTCARTAGWSAHILEQKRTGRLIRPAAVYVGPPARGAEDVDGWNPDWA